MKPYIAEALPPGTQLQGGKFTIKEALGQGATGITYMASMRQMLEGNLSSYEDKIDVAIKEFYMKNECQRGATTSNVMVPNTKNDLQVRQYKESFVKEARKISGLSHPNIVHVLGVFNENDTVYYVMQFIRGGSLKDLIDSHGTVPEQEALKYTRQIASALDYMHTQKKMCHYDLKPGNIMLSESNDAMLIDFGIAKNYDEQGHETSTTPPGLTKGFAPLEQYSSIEGFSPKSDVYSLGATLYAMLCGQTPPEPMAWVSQPFTPKPSGVSEQAWSIVRKAMSLASKNRPTMAEIVGMIDGMGISGRTDYYDMPGKGGQRHGTDDEETILGSVQNPYNEETQIINNALNPSATNNNKKPSKPDNGNTKSLIITALATALAIIIGFGAYRFAASMGKEEIVNPDTITEKPIYSPSGQKVMTYRGQVVDGKPQGRGILKYLDNKKESYEGAFLNGLCEDSMAVLRYRNGDIYRGSFIAGRLGTGSFFIDKTGEYFRGTFRDDKPYNGVWYDKADRVISRVVKGNVE